VVFPPVDLAPPPQPPELKSRTVSTKPKRAVSPHTVISQKYQEQQEMKAFVKILIAVAVVAAIAVATFYIVRHAK